MVEMGLRPSRRPSGVGVATLEQVVVGNDLSKLSPGQRLEYYTGLCRSLGLNPLTRPFQYIVLNGKLTLYATRDATDQLRKGGDISIQIVAREMVGDIYVVTARASRAGRQDESTGAVDVKGLRGEALANAYMKAETKAKRRVTLSICGLGMSDETEVVTIPGASLANVDMETGEVVSTPALSESAESFSAGPWFQSIGGTKPDFDRLRGLIAERSPEKTWGYWFKEAADEGCATVEEMEIYIYDQLLAKAEKTMPLDDGPGNPGCAATATEAPATPASAIPGGKYPGLTEYVDLTEAQYRKLQAAEKTIGKNLAQEAAICPEKTFAALYARMTGQAAVTA